jgi:hypothetical protein
MDQGIILIKQGKEKYSATLSVSKFLAQKFSYI